MGFIQLRLAKRMKKKAENSRRNRELIGIGLMHKSNLVPVWDEESAKEITLMKGNK